MDYFNDKKKVVSFCQLFLCNESSKKKRTRERAKQKKASGGISTGGVSDS